MLKRITVFSILLFVAATLFFCSSPEKEATPEQYASLDTATHYVGISTCASCHHDIYTSYLETGMGKSFAVASKGKSAGLFDGHIIHDAQGNFSYYPYFDGDHFMLREFRKKGSDTVYRQDVAIHYIVGSGQHTNSHMVNHNGYLFQAPATFYTQKGIWDLPPGFEHGNNSRFTRKIELECMSCHNGFPQMVPGSENKYARVPNGIDCERCHGPGSRHVEEKQKGNRVDTSKAIDYTIVNPAKLGIDRQLDVCQRCHIQGNAVLVEGKSFYDYRPGMALSDVMNVFMPVYKGQENEHIMASHAERMKMSPCFLVSVQKAEQRNKEHPSLKPYKDAMTCVTCHNPHVSVKKTGADVFNAACRNCHSAPQPLKGGKMKERSSVSCNASLAERHKVADNCTSCHMPKNTTIDIPHVMTTDHYIRKPVAPSQVEKIREFIGLACINNPSPDSMTRGNAYLSYFEKFDHRRPWLDSAKKYLRDGTPAEVKQNFHSLVRWAYLAQDYRRVTEYANQAGQRPLAKSYSNQDAWTVYRIGEAYSQLGMKEHSMKQYEKAVELAPFVPEFRNKLGTAQVENERIAEARKNFAFLVKESPNFVQGYVNLGYLTLAADRDAQRADKLYEKALDLDPDNEQALLNRAGTQMFLENPGEAKKLLERLLVVNPQHPTAQKLLNTLR